jgi:hypothetical protein
MPSHAAMRIFRAEFILPPLALPVVASSIRRAAESGMYSIK